MSGKKKNRNRQREENITPKPEVKSKKQDTSSSKTKDPHSRLKWLVFLLPFLLYANTLSNKYSMDDDLVTTETNQITTRGISALPTIFTTLYSENDTQAYEYRPFVSASFAIEHQLLGVNPVTSHFIQILLYALLCLIVFKTSRRIFSQLGIWFHFLVALFFIFHPLHTEVVASIKNRDEILALLFSLLALNSFLTHAQTNKWKYLVYGTLFFLVAWFSKRSSLPYLTLIPLSVYFANILPVDENGKITRQSLKKLFSYGIILLVVCVGVQKLISHGLLGQDLFHRETYMFENPLYLENPGFIGKLGMAGYTVGYYFKLMLVPHPLVCYYGYNYVDYVGWNHWLSFVGFVLAAGGGLYALYKIRTRQVWVFGILVMLTSLSMFANLVKPAVGIIAERFAFEATLGFCFLAAWAVFKLHKIELTVSKWPKGKPLLGGMLVVIFGLYSFKTITRNKDWYNAKTVYFADARSAPQSTKIQSLLASTYTTALQENLMGKRPMTQAQQYTYIDSAIACFKNAVRIFPRYISANNNLGMVYFTYQNEVDSAEKYIANALKYNPDYLQAHYNMATIYEQKFMRKMEMKQWLQRSFPGDSTVAYETLSPGELKIFDKLDSLLEPQLNVVNQFEVNVVNTIKNIIKNTQGNFQPQMMVNEIQKIVNYSFNQLNLPPVNNTALSENIVREVKKRSRGVKTTIDKSLDSLSGVYFDNVLTQFYRKYLVSAGASASENYIPKFKSYAAYTEHKLRQKSYFHWRRTLDIECTYHNSREKIREWNTKNNDYDSTIAINTRFLNCRNFKSVDSYWYIGYAWLAKGDTLKAVESFEKMLVQAQRLVNRNALVIDQMTKVGNIKTLTFLRNNFYNTASSINQVINEMLLYYSKQNRNEDIKRVQEIANKLQALVPSS